MSIPRWLSNLIQKLPYNEKRSSPFPDWRAAGMVLLGAIGIGLLLYRVPMLGWDWYIVFGPGQEATFWYPGWTRVLAIPFASLPWRWGLTFSNGLTIAALAVVTFREGKSRWGYLGAILAVVSFPILILIWDGQVDGWALLGYLLLPWGVPILLIKPTIGAFALLAKRSWFVAGIIFAILSVLIWGWWPDQALGLHVIGDYANVDAGGIVQAQQHPMGMGWYVLGWPIAILGLVLMLFTNRKDPLHLMAAGSFLMPYVFPYHFILLMPSMGRLKSLRLGLLWAVSWTLLFPFGFGPESAWLGYLFPAAVWWFLRPMKAPELTWLAEIGRVFQKTFAQQH